MREIYLKMQGKLAEIKKLGDGDAEKVAGLLDELDALEKEFELAKRLYETETKYVEKGAEEQDEEDNKPILMRSLWRSRSPGRGMSGSSGGIG